MIHQVLFFRFLIVIFALLTVNLYYCIDIIIVHWSWNFPCLWLQIILGQYQKWTYGFASPAGLWKVMARILVSCSILFASIYWYTWSKISYKLFFKALYFGCWLVCIIFIGSAFIDTDTCPLVLLQMFSELYTNRTYEFPLHRFMEGHGKGAGFAISSITINTLVGFKLVPQVHCDWHQANHLKVLLLTFVKFIFSSEGVVDLQT